MFLSPTLLLILLGTAVAGAIIVWAFMLSSRGRSGAALVQCPQCGAQQGLSSRHTERRGSSAPFAPVHRYQCPACGHGWQEERRE